MFELDQNTVQHRYKVLEYLARTAVDLVATVRRYRYVGTGTALQLYRYSCSINILAGMSLRSSYLVLVS